MSSAACVYQPMGISRVNDTEAQLTEATKALMAEALTISVGIIRTMAKEPSVLLLNGQDALEIVANAIEAGLEAQFGS